MLKVPQVLILEDSKTIGALFQAHFRGEPVGITLVETATEAREAFRIGSFDVIVLDGIAPSGLGTTPSLVGPILAREFRQKGYKRPLVAISNDLQAQQLMKQAGCRHLCEKDRLPGLIRELLGLLTSPK